MFETVLLKITTIMLEQRQNEMSIQATLDEANLIEAMLAEQDELTAAKSLDSFDKADPQTHGSALRIQIQDMISAMQRCQVTDEPEDDGEEQRGERHAPVVMEDKANGETIKVKTQQ